MKEGWSWTTTQIHMNCGVVTVRSMAAVVAKERSIGEDGNSVQDVPVARLREAIA